MTLDVRETLRRLPLFADAGGAAFDAVVGAGYVQRWARGEHLIEEHEPSEHLFVLVEGVVGVFYSSEKGEGVLVKIFGAPSAFGEMELLTGLPRLELVEAFEPATCVVLPRAPLLALWREQAPTTMAMLTDLARRLCVAAYHERMLAFLDTETRLAALLLSFLDAYARELEDGGTMIKLPLTHEMLARCLGVTTRSIDRTVKKWSEAGFFERKKGYIVITDRAALGELAPEDRLGLFNQLFHADDGG
jgi:CRP-like cAMP-binding protein